MTSRIILAVGSAAQATLTVVGQTLPSDSWANTARELGSWGILVLILAYFFLKHIPEERKSRREQYEAAEKERAAFLKALDARDSKFDGLASAIHEMNAAMIVMMQTQQRTTEQPRYRKQGQ